MLQRRGSFPKETLDELRFLHRLDSKLNKDWILTITMGFIILVTLFFALVSVALDTDNEEEKEEDQRDEEFQEEENEDGGDLTLMVLMGFMFIFMGTMLEKFFQNSLPFLDKIKVSPISRESMAIYKRMRRLATRLAFCIGLTTLLLYLFVALIIMEGGDPAFLFYIPLIYLLLVVVLFLVNTCALGLAEIVLNSHPRTLEGVILKERLLAVGMALVLSHLLLFMGDMLPSMFLGSNQDLSYYAELPILRALLYPPYIASLVIMGGTNILNILLFIVATVFLGFFLEKHIYLEKRKEHAVSREPHDLRLLLKKERARLKGLNPEETEESWNQRKPPEEYETGILTYYSLEGGKGNAPYVMALALIPANLILTYPFYLLMGPAFPLFMLGMFLMVGMGSFPDPLTRHGSKAQGAVRLVPENPERMVEIYLGKLSSNYLKFIAAIFWILSLLILVPLQLPGGSEHHPDWQTALIFAVLIPLHGFALLLLSRSLVGKEDYPEHLREQRPPSPWVHEILLLIYWFLLLVKLDFLGNLALSLAFHLGLALFMLVLAWSSTRMRILDFLSCHKLSSGQQGVPARKFMRESQLKNTAFRIGALLLLVFMFYPAEMAYTQPLEYRDFRMGPIPEENRVVYEEDTLIKDQILELDQNLIIEANFTLENSSLIFTSGKPGELGLYVSGTGKLILEKAEITSQSYMNFEVYGEMEAGNSSISRVQGDENYARREGGIELYTKQKKVSMFNTSISNCQTNGILAKNSWLEVENCSFWDIGSDAVELEDSYLKMKNCTIRDCRYGILASGTDGYITGTTVEEVKKGAFNDRMGNDLDLRNNDFEASPGLLIGFLGIRGATILVLVTVILAAVPWGDRELIRELWRRRQKGEGSQEGGDLSS